MSQLEWGSDKRGLPLPVADVMESLFNSTFDHNGRKAPLPYATEADVQALLTMLFMTYLSGGNPPLFMDFRKVWEAWEIKQLAKKVGIKGSSKKADWLTKGLVELHGGTLEVKSKKGKGTMITVTFPKERVVPGDATS